MADQLLLNGVRLFKKKPNAPDFVIADGIITPDDLNAFLIDNAQYLTEYNGVKQLRFQVLLSKDGNPYMAVNTYKATAAPTQVPGGAVSDVEDTSGLPF